MKNIFNFLFLFGLLFVLPGCAIAGGIFKAGVWVGVLIVVAIIGLIIFLASRGGKN